MALEIEGRIVSKLNVQRGTSARGAWEKQEFVVEIQDGNFPTQVCMNVWGADKVKDFEKYQVGDKVRIAFNLSSREYNGRWYTDVRAWRIEPASAPTGGGAPYNPDGGETGHGVSSQPMPPAAPAPTIDDMPSEVGEDDLPF